MHRTLWAATVVVCVATGCSAKGPTRAPSPPLSPGAQTSGGGTPQAEGRGGRSSSSPAVAPSIRLDTQGVEFGPWLASLSAHIKRHWFIPFDAASERGRVVITMVIWKDGRITDVKIVERSAVESFNRSAEHAVVASSPAKPMPADYPDEKSIVTMTFYFNEAPPGR